MFPKMFEPAGQGMLRCGAVGSTFPTAAGPGEGAGQGTALRARQGWFVCLRGTGRAGSGMRWRCERERGCSAAGQAVKGLMGRCGSAVGTVEGVQ